MRLCPLLRTSPLHPHPGRRAGAALRRAVDFLVALHGRFEHDRRDLLVAARGSAKHASMPVSARISCRRPPTVRSGRLDASPGRPSALRDRRVEITGPVDRKMMINALNSGAKVFMADLEDANSPTWDNVITGQVNLVRRGARDDRARHRSRRPTACAPTTSSRRWSCGRAAGTWSRSTSGRRRADLGQPVRLRPVRVPQRLGEPAARLRALLLPAEARGPPRSPTLERGHGRRRGRARPRPRLDPRDGADRDDHRGVRDGRDPLRAAERICGLNAGRWDYIFSIAKRFHDDPAFVLPTGRR